jgi:hypothetical protein
MERQKKRKQNLKVELINIARDKTPSMAAVLVV